MNKRNEHKRVWFLKQFLFFAFLVLYLPIVNSYTQPTESSKIELGISTIMSGPTQFYGVSMRLGIEAYFARINRQGGIGGKKLHLICLDDGYLPELAKKNIYLLADKYNVLAILGNAGTLTAQAVVPVVKIKKILLFSPYTGANFLRKTPPDRYVINYRPSYAHEIDAMIKALRDYSDIRPYEIAFFTQNDSYGDEGYNGAVNALKTYYGFSDMHLLVHGRYERNTTKVQEGVMKILDAKIKPKVIIMVSTCAPSVAFIRSISPVLPNTIFLNLSASTEKLALELKGECDRVIMTQVTPHYTSTLPICKDYQADLKIYSEGSKPGFISLEGYIAARIFCEGLRRAYEGGRLNREGIIDAIEGIRGLDIRLGTGGDGKKITISYSKKRHQAIDTVWPTRIQGNEIKEFDWKDLPKLLSGK